MCKLTLLIRSLLVNEACFDRASAPFSQGYGTCEDTLIRVLVSRSEVDLKKIAEEYRAMYDMTLQDAILVK